MFLTGDGDKSCMALLSHLKPFMAYWLEGQSGTVSRISQSIFSTLALEITCLAVEYFKPLRAFKVPWAWKTNTTIPQNLEVFSYCTSQSKASTSTPKQQPGYKFHIHVGQFKVIKYPTLGKLQSLCDLSQSTTCEATTFPFEIIHSPFVLLQAPRHTGIMWLGRGRGWAYGVDAFLSSPEQAFFTIGFAQTNE